MTEIVLYLDADKSLVNEQEKHYCHKSSELSPISNIILSFVSSIVADFFYNYFSNRHTRKPKIHYMSFYRMRSKINNISTSLMC